MTGHPCAGNPTAEEFHYQFDSVGRLTHAAFAQTAQNGSAPYYTAEEPADSRAHAVYQYGPGGQMWGLAQYWEVLGTGEYPYSSEPIVGSRYYSMNGAAYVPYYDELGLRERLDVMVNSSGAWAVSRSEFYTYDVLGQLTSVDYNDGLANEFQSWTYDPAGNRSNSGYSYDSLNRMSASPGYVYQNDILGNRTWRNFGLPGVQRYVWDEVNRAQSICGETVGARYEYRADGMRVKKVADLTITWNPGDENQGSGFYDENLSVNKPTTRYYYDGQMCVEEDYTVWVGPFQGQSTVVTRYGVGARGIDWMEKSGSGGGVSFPLYDGHGNMIATLSRSGSGSFAVSNARSDDVWGSVRSGSSSGYPNTRYCAHLGHKQDDESGLLYMRARYYEPWTGRFVTEDPVRDGCNWYIYCQNHPGQRVDATGTTAGDIIGGTGTGLQLELSMASAAMRSGGVFFQRLLAAFSDHMLKTYVALFSASGQTTGTMTGVGGVGSVILKFVIGKDPSGSAFRIDDKWVVNGRSEFFAMFSARNGTFHNVDIKHLGEDFIRWVELLLAP
ncbi:MAG: hypothetical protein AKCLJLPJ_00773 [Fimbriimonadales bacterium]|nr:hypothetical protein [Fimbriimonadales bacterium]